MGKRLNPEIDVALQLYVGTGEHEPLRAAIEAYGRRCVRRASNIDWNVARLGDAEVGVENIARTELLESDQ